MSELAEGLLRKFIEECLMIEDGIALIDSGWVDVTPEEAAYLERLRAERDAHGWT